MKVLIVDDEPLARDTVRDALKGEEDMRIVAECGDGEEAVAAVREHGPDLVFLDIRMPGLSGFEVLGELDGATPDIVFVTAHDEHALRAFEVNAVDYLLKPFTDERFRETMRRVRERSSGSVAASPRQLRRLLRRLEAGRDASPAETAEPTEGPVGEYARRFMVRSGERIRFVGADEIDWFEADGNYVVLHVGEEDHRVRATLSGMEEQLDPADFVRVHRSAIVNLDSVREVQPWFSGDYVAILTTGDRVKVSRTYRDTLLRDAF